MLFVYLGIEHDSGLSGRRICEEQSFQLVSSSSMFCTPCGLLTLLNKLLLLQETRRTTSYSLLAETSVKFKYLITVTVHLDKPSLDRQDRNRVGGESRTQAAEVSCTVTWHFSGRAGNRVEGSRFLKQDLSCWLMLTSQVASPFHWEVSLWSLSYKARKNI